MTNDVIDCILSRRSIRSYSSRPVEDEKLNLILKCGSFAATARGLQPWHFTLVKDRALLDRISAENEKIMHETGVKPMSGDLTVFDNFRGAPCAVIVSGDKSARYAEADCANATQNMALAAHSLMLGSCYIASFRPAFELHRCDDVLRKLELPEGYVPMFALALGYASSEAPERAPRRDGIINIIE